MSDSPIRVLTSDDFQAVLVRADADRAMVVADARIAFSEAMVEAEKTWAATAGAALGWERDG